MPFSNNFPYTDLHEININKFLKAIKNLLGGHGGEYLRKKSNIPFDYEWSPVAVSSGVNSVNGQTGDVILDASDVGALPDSYTPPPAPVQSVNGQTGAVVLNASNVGAISSTEQVGYMTVDPYLTVLQAVNSYIEKGNSIAEIFFSGKANTQFPVGYEIVTSAPIPKTWFNFIGVKNNSSIISLRVTQSGSIATNEVISVDDTIYFHAIYMM